VSNEGTPLLGPWARFKKASEEAMLAFLRVDSSYQTSGAWAAGRDAWEAAIKWAHERTVVAPELKDGVDPREAAWDRALLWVTDLIDSRVAIESGAPALFKAGTANALNNLKDHIQEHGENRRDLCIHGTEPRERLPVANLAPLPPPVPHPTAGQQCRATYGPPDKAGVHITCHEPQGHHGSHYAQAKVWWAVEGSA